MKHGHAGLLFLLSTALFLSGCAHQNIARTLDAKLDRESGLRTGDAPAAQSPALGDEQRARLAALQKVLRQQLAEQRGESLKLQSILLKDVVAARYDADEVSLIKIRLKSVETKRVALMLEALEQAKTILGQESPNHERDLRALLSD